MVYSIILDAFAHLVSLDIAWFVNLIFGNGNLFWVFVFLAAAFFFFGGKKNIPGFFIILIYIWAFTDVSRMTGWIFGGFLIVAYLAGALFLEALAESSKWISINSAVISTIWFLVAWIGYYFFFA